MEIKMYSTREFAGLVGVSVKTLYNWDKSGLLLARRKLNGYKYYTEQDVCLVLNLG